ncbi:MAG: glucose-6-phosphate dehydrogenase [Actinobacteria bacterium]|nr:glucose-6-phosphate dehydrogenase [Actinomycetota bacterium]MCL5882659.1 glucose-6-phosphate dehydrogenase [Actinomycetota bacterium]
MDDVQQATDAPPIQTQYCEIPLKQYTMEPFAMMIFGGAGDLSQNMLMPALYHLYLDGELPKDFFVAGAGLPAMSDEEYRNLMSEAMKRNEEKLDQKKWTEFKERLYYISGDFSNNETYEQLRVLATELGKKCGNNIIYYLAVAPSFTEQVVKKLKEFNLCRGAFRTKLILEKPFGRDHASAVELNTVLLEAFDERQIYRIDHYLGKETVQNITFFRFSNTIFEELWNQHHIDNVQITVAESEGIRHRGEFYEGTGVVRDIVQNHLLQLVSLIAMEPPASFEAESLRDEKVKVLRSMVPLDPEDVDRNCVRGQFGPGLLDGKKLKGYRQSEGIREDSVTPTFFAGKFLIANWRWAGVPFYVRTGKRMPRRTTEIVIQFKQPPLKLFDANCNQLEPNLLVLKIQPDEDIFLRFGVKYPFSPNQIHPVKLEFSSQRTFHAEPHPVYEKLLVDCMEGDPTLFVRQDAVLAMWDAVDPINKRWEVKRPAFPNYESGTWGPPEADHLLERDGRRWLSV